MKTEVLIEASWHHMFFHGFLVAACEMNIADTKINARS
jgi:hypothetical protein